MPRLTSFVLILFVAVTSLVVGQEKEKAHPQEALDTAITHAVKLLEGKKYKELIDNYVLPEDLKQMKEVGQYEIVVKKFGEGEKAKRLLEALKKAQKVEPEYNEGKTIATFKISPGENEAASTQRPVVFKKSGQKWYIGN